MMRKLAIVGGLVAVLSVAPVGVAGVASACPPDPGYPCDPQPYPAPDLWCKLTPFC